MYWITLAPHVGQVLVADEAEESKVRKDYEANAKAQADAVAKQAKAEKTAAENELLEEADSIKAARKER
jgi:hypothetical protein